jgi:hypothetical protein
MTSRSLASLFALALAGCAAPAAPPAPLPAPPAAPRSPIPDVAIAERPAKSYAPVLLPGVPHVRQKPDFCGEACAAMALSWMGRPTSQDAVFELAGIDPALGRGAYTRELNIALTRLGFRVGDVFYAIPAATAGAELERHFAAMHADLLRGVPSIVCMHYDDSPRTTEHFRLVVGYDPAKDEVVYHEPAADDGGYRRMPRARLLRLWPLAYQPDRYTLIRFRLDLDPAAPRAPEQQKVHGHTASEYAQHVLALRERLGREFTVVIEPPFVVAGDEEPGLVRARAERIVRWATTKLKADFFDKEPQKILDVLLFHDGRTYRKKAIELFHAEPETPYGYYSSQHDALVMNISTGGGTLVHEIVHPFVEADFPDAPPWLNEGLGSLFEQSDERDGHIVGLTNWRLAGLQKAIRLRRLPPFEPMLRADTHAFYDEDPGTNYAQARYLCYWLQEQGLLPRSYREFRARHAEDPSGIETLRRVIGERDLAAFQARWERFVLGLHFP